MELPLHVMDTALFYPGYLNLSEADAEKMVWLLLDDVARFGGALTIQLARPQHRSRNGCGLTSTSSCWVN